MLLAAAAAEAATLVTRQFCLLLFIGRGGRNPAFIR
jgi:hypothetical protein